MFLGLLCFGGYKWWKYEQREAEKDAERTQRKEKEEQLKVETRSRKRAKVRKARDQFELGEDHQYGSDIPQDYSEALKCYRLAAELGNTEAQLELGMIYRYGKCAPKNDTEAVKWFRLAAEKGHAKAQRELADQYSTYSSEKDPEEARKWRRLASEQGDVEAQLSLASSYLHGSHVSQDKVLAHKWFNLVSATGKCPYAADGDYRPPDMQRDLLEEKMTREEIIEAQRLASEWKPKTWKKLKKTLPVEH